MITELADFFTRGCGRCARFDSPACSALRWSDTVEALRCICLQAGLDEALRWGQPCYRHAGRNIAVMGAVNDGVRLGLFEAGLLADPAGLLTRGGPNTAVPDTLRIASADEVSRLAPALRDLLAQAMRHAEAGRRAPKPAPDLTLPEELVTALDADPALAEAFHSLTPGRQRSHVIALSSVKSSAARLARIERLRPRILAGKGASEG